MRVIVIAILLGSIMLFASGCSSVTTRHPLSGNPEAIEKEEFEGTWIADDNVFHVKFAGNGVAQIAGVEWESDQFHIVHGEMIVTKGNEHNFISVRFEENGKWMDDYAFLSYKFTDQGDLVLWVPDIDVFEEMVEKNLLQGVVRKGQYSTNITITDTSAKILEIINNPDNLKIFRYREPVFLRKLAGKKE